MQKKTQLLKWVGPLLTLLAILGNTFIGISTTQADSSSNSCQLSFVGGPTQLLLGQVDSSIQSALQGTSLTNCTASPVPTSCTLIEGFGDTAIDYGNLGSAGTLVKNLKKANVNLNCGSSSNTSNSNGPTSGSCQLAWIGVGGGSVTLDASQVTNAPNYPGLQQTLEGYNLRCTSDVSATSCSLVPGTNDSGNTELDLANMQNRSPWIYGGLNGKYGLNCNR